jgi:hypothetical protein
VKHLSTPPDQHEHFHRGLPLCRSAIETTSDDDFSKRSACQLLAATAQAKGGGNFDKGGFAVT